MKKIYVLILLLSVSILFGEIEEIRIRSAQSKEDITHSYFKNLLKLAINKTKDDFGEAEIVEINVNMSQGRALYELSINRSIDIDWAGTNKKREKDLYSIRIPLIGGLLGYRVPVILNENQKRFDKIKNLADFKNFTAIQGTHWPDSDILEASGLKIERVTEFRLMYNMLRHKRVDYFPRGLNEVYAEIKDQKDLTAYDRIIFHYTFPMYFFTSKKNTKLAKRIEIGLKKAIADGSFLKFIKNNPSTSHIFPLSKYDNSLIIEIGNPFLPEKTPIDDSSLWIELE